MEIKSASAEITNTDAEKAQGEFLEKVRSGDPEALKVLEQARNEIKGKQKALENSKPSSPGADNILGGFGSAHKEAGEFLKSDSAGAEYKAVLSKALEILQGDHELALSGSAAHDLVEALKGVGKG